MKNGNMKVIIYIKIMILNTKNNTKIDMENKNEISTSQQLKEIAILNNNMSTGKLPSTRPICPLMRIIVYES